MLDTNPLYNYIPVIGMKEYQEAHYSSSNTELLNIKTHYHNVYEIVLYKNILGTLYLDGSRRSIGNNQLLFIPPFSPHGFSLPKQKSEYYVLHISAEFYNLLPGTPELLTLNQKDYIVIQTLLSWSNDDAYHLDMRLDSVKMLLNMITNKIKSRYNVSDRSKSLFVPLLKYIDENLNYSISIKDASELCHMSRTSFMNKFKSHFNTSFHNFLLDIKNDKSKHLLTHSDMTCSEIAQVLGFSDASHFTKFFKSKNDKLPYKYRADYR